MTLFEAMILGTVQGLTEFIPVSSTGHLVVTREFLGLNTSGALAFDAVLQLASALAILVYFGLELVDLAKDKVLVKSVIIGTLIAIVLGLLLEGLMETTFRSATLVAATLILGALLMWLAEYFAKQNRNLDIKKGFVIGLFQSLALVPGVSRSGATISGGLLMGLTRENATEFSFLLALPVILGSGLKKLFELGETGFSDIGLNLLVGSIFSFAFSLFAISFLIKYLKNHRLTPFIWYRIVLAVMILILV